jgi:hypothetical protein
LNANDSYSQMKPAQEGEKNVGKISGF